MPATEVIGPISGIRIINDFTICVCLKDTDIMLLLRMFYAFFFSFYSSFSPNLRSLLLSRNERDNLNFNAMVEWSQFAVDYFRICLI